MIGVWIPLSQGKHAIVDAADHERVIARGKWSAKIISGIWYAVRVENKHMLYLHRFILGAPGHTDHRDGDGLNCQRDNIRPATRTQNNRNRRIQRNNKTGFKGVSRRRGGTWVARIVVARKPTVLGLFTSPVDAAKSYDASALELFGEFAKLNFPEKADALAKNLTTVTAWLGCPRCGGHPHVIQERPEDMDMGCISCGWIGLFSECWEDTLAPLEAA